MTDPSSSAESRLARLLGRLLSAAESSLAAGDLEAARAAAEEVLAVDPDNERAAQVLQHLVTRQRGTSGERVLMTLLFADLVGSTSLSERLEPEHLRDLFAAYRAEAREAVERYGGYVMKYMGDGILAGFGFPDPHEDDGRRAVLAGLDLIAAMAAAGPDLERRLRAAPEVRIGLHTGQVVVTDLSDDRSVDERDSVVGVAPNLAARIQQSAEPGMVVISDVTRHLVDSDFHLHSLGVQQLKGIGRPVEVYAVDRPRHAGARYEAERYRTALMVGRDQPRDRLLAGWGAARAAADADASTGSAALVVGEPGIGKTRLVAELVERVQADGGSALGTGCLPYYSNVSLWPIGRMVERALGLDVEDSDRLGPLVENLRSAGLEPVEMVPFLGPLIGVTDVPEYPAPQLDPSAFLAETLERLVDWLSVLARDKPRLLVVEDLHWADPSTIGLLGRLVERRPPGVLAVATTRDATSIPWQDSVDVVELTRLERETATGLVDRLSAGHSLSDAERARIVEQAEGIPLFVEELTQNYVDHTPTERIPLRLQELLTWRLKAPGVDPRVAQVAATVGPSFDAATVSTVIGDHDVVAAQLRLLTTEGIIEPAPGPDTYRFRHALMRDAAYETQVLDVRRQTHTLVADSIAELGAEPALVAEHLDLAGEAGRAVALYLAAAQAEQARGAHTEAGRLLSRELELLDTLPETDERDLAELTARMLRALSLSSMQGYGAPDVQSDHQNAERLTARLGHRPEVLPSLIAIWSFWLVTGELGTAEGVVDRLAQLVEDEAYSWFAPEVEACAGYVDFYEGHLTSAQEHLERAMAGFDARPDDQKVSPFWPLPNDSIAVTAIALACLATLRGEPERAREWEAAGLRRAEEIGFPRGPFSLAFVKTYAAWNRLFTGEQAASQQLGAEVVGIGQEHGYAYWVLLGSSYYATATPGGPPDRVFLEQTVVTLRMMGQQAFAASNLASLATLYAEGDDVDRAFELVGEALEVVHKSGEHVHLPELLRLRARYTVERGGDAQDAADDLAEAVRVAAQQGAHVARLRAALDLAQLTGEARPTSWRAVLSGARAAVPPTLVTDETDAADRLLAG